MRGCKYVEKWYGMCICLCILNLLRKAHLLPPGDLAFGLSSVYLTGIVSCKATCAEVSGEGSPSRKRDHSQIRDLIFVPHIVAFTMLVLLLISFL
jgi:hypothetical protein